MKNKKVIINADDYGLTSAVSNGIRLAYLNGIVTSTSVMANGMNIGEDLQLLKEDCPDIGIGVHLTLTSLSPISPLDQVQSLINDKGTFFSLDKLLTNLIQFSDAELYLEWTSQIETVKNSGITIDHLDSHHNIAYLSDTTYRVFKELAINYNLPIRYPASPHGDVDFIKRCISELNTHHILFPEEIDMSFVDKDDKLDALKAIFKSLDRNIIEIPCHPGIVDDHLRVISSLQEVRAEELRALCSADIKNRIVELGIQLTTYGEVFDFN